MRNFTSITRLQWVQLWLVAGLCACGSSADLGTEGANPGGSKCSTNSECASGVCSSGVCQGNGLGAPTNGQCASNDQCASQSCSAAGICNPGSLLTDGKSCLTSSECASQQCVHGICGTQQSGTGGAGSGANGVGGVGSATTGVGATGGIGNSSAGGNPALGGTTSAGTYTYVGKPPFNGDKNFTPLTPGCGPDTAHSCIPCSHPDGAGTTATVLRPPAFLCFSGDASKGSIDPTPDDPAGIIEQVVETLNGKSYVHVRVTFDPTFVDNTYGANAIGWNPNRPHTFVSDLTKSDHLDLLLTDGTGKTVMELGEDYISSLSASTTTPDKRKGTGGTTSISTSTPTTGCGYGTLGVLGGDGYMTTGSGEYVLAAATSQDRNLVGCGYCQSAACSADGASAGDCTVNSPKTDSLFAANSLTPDWNYTVVYEVWIDLAAFGSAGFGQAFMEYVHASPSKASADTLYVSPSPCPPGLGHCTAGQDCWVNGTGDAGGPPPDAGTGTCPQNSQVYTAADGTKSCTPIPFANYNNHDACPTGYVLDTASEGRYCLPQ